MDSSIYLFFFKFLSKFLISNLLVFSDLLHQTSPEDLSVIFIFGHLIDFDPWN